MTATEMLEYPGYPITVSLMDDEIREQLHSTIAPCSDLEFLEAYAQEHEKKYGKPFEI